MRSIQRLIPLSAMGLSCLVAAGALLPQMVPGKRFRALRQSRPDIELLVANAEAAEQLVPALVAVEVAISGAGAAPTEGGANAGAMDRGSAVAVPRLGVSGSPKASPAEPQAAGADRGCRRPRAPPRV